MDQVTTTLMQTASPDNIYDASLQSIRYKLTNAAHNKICYSDSLNIWVVACSNNTIGVSKNSVDWEHYNLGTTNDLNYVTFANGLFVAVGSSSSVYTSTNGYDWIQRSFPVAGLTLTEVVYANNTWVVSCNTGSQQIFTSTDTITWTLKWNTTAILSNTNRYPITYYATGIWATILGGQVATSSDGQTWTLRPISSNIIFSHIHYTGSIWLAAGALVGNTSSIVLSNSTDGITWSAPYTISTSTSIRMLTSNGSNVLISTQAGNMWTSVDNGFTGAFVSTGQGGLGTTLVYGNSRWVLTSGSGDVMVSTTNGVTWTRPVTSGFGTTGSMIYANNTFVSGSTGGVIRTSTDGTTWDSTPVSGTTSNIQDIKYFDGKFVAVTSNGSIRTSTTGGGTWSQPTSPTAGSISRISFGNALWVAVGNGIILTSPDAASWTLNSATTNNNLGHIEYNNGVWVGYGSNNTIIRSINGTSWSVVNRDLSQPRSIAFGNNVWTAVGTSGEITTSSDLNNWTFRTSGTTNQLNRVIYRNNTFLTVGASGTIRTSPDSITWTSRPSNTTNAFNDVEYNSVQDCWYAVGASGTYRFAKTPNIATNWLGSTVSAAVTLLSIGFSALKNKFLFASSVGVIWEITGDFSQLVPPTVINNGGLQGVTHISNGLYSIAGGTVSTNFCWFAVGSGGNLRRANQVVSNDFPSPLGWLSGGATGTTNALQKIVYGNGIFVAVGVSGTIISNSTSSTTFTLRTSGTAQTLNDVAYGLVNGTTPTWVAVGNSGTILRSTDGATWAAATNTGGLSTNTANCVTFANNQFVVGNAGNIANIRYSNDGNTWTAATGTTNNNSVLDVVYGNSTFIATTANFAYTSTNGTTWTAAATGTDLQKLVVQNAGYYITYLNNKFIAFPNAQTNVIYVSKNGTNWYQVPVPFTIRDSIDYANGVYVIAGGRAATTGYVGNSTI